MLNLFNVFQIHVFLTILVICLLCSSMAAIRRQIFAVGRSKTLFAGAHCLFGYVFFAVFVFQILTGFLRPQNIRLRCIAIFIHWLMGTILNYGGGKLQL